MSKNNSIWSLTENKGNLKEMKLQELLEDS